MQKKMGFRTFILSLCAEHMNLMINETAQIERAALYLTDNEDDISPYAHVYAVLSEISYGTIYSPHFTQEEAKQILDILRRFRHLD